MVTIVDSGIDVPCVPDSCPDSTRTARDSLQAFVDEMTDDLTYEQWLRDQLADA